MKKNVSKSLRALREIVARRKRDAEGRAIIRSIFAVGRQIGKTELTEKLFRSAIERREQKDFL